MDHMNLFIFASSRKKCCSITCPSKFARLYIMSPVLRSLYTDSHVDAAQHGNNNIYDNCAHAFYAQPSHAADPELNISFCAYWMSAIGPRLVFTFLPNYCHCVEWQIWEAYTHQAN